MYTKKNILMGLFLVAAVSSVPAHAASSASGAGVSGSVSNGVATVLGFIKKFAGYALSYQEGWSVKAASTGADQARSTCVPSTLGVWSARAIVAYFVANKVWNYATAPAANSGKADSEEDDEDLS